MNLNYYFPPPSQFLDTLLVEGTGNSAMVTTLEMQDLWKKRWPAEVGVSIRNPAVSLTSQM